MATKKNSIAKVGDANNYLKSPRPYNGLKGDFDIIHVRVLTRLAMEISPMVDNQLSEIGEQRISKTFLPDSSFKDGIATINMPLSTFGVKAKDYNDIRDACKHLLDQKVYDEYTDGKKKVWRGQNVFSAIQVENDTETGKLQVHVEVTKAMAERIFTLAHGYSEYNRNIAISCRMPRAVRIYQLLSNNRDYGVAIIDYNELKDYLGVLEHDKDNYGTIIKDKYPYFSHFRAHVLDKCRKALKDLVDKGELDYYFDYEPIYNRPKKDSDDPDAIRFTLLPPIAEIVEINEDSKTEPVKQRTLTKNAAGDYQLMKKLATIDDWAKQALIDAANGKPWDVDDFEQHAKTAGIL